MAEGPAAGLAASSFLTTRCFLGRMVMSVTSAPSTIRGHRFCSMGDVGRKGHRCRRIARKGGSIEEHLAMLSCVPESSASPAAGKAQC